MHIAVPPKYSSPNKQNQWFYPDTSRKSLEEIDEIFMKNVGFNAAVIDHDDPRDEESQDEKTSTPSEKAEHVTVLDEKTATYQVGGNASA